MSQITITTTVKTVFSVPDGVDIQQVRHLCLPELADDEERTDEVALQQCSAINHCYLGDARRESLHISHSVSEGVDL